MAFTKEQDIIGHTAILSDFHRWMNENREIDWWQNKETIAVQYVSPCEYDWQLEVDSEYEIPYDSSEDLFDQSEETLKRIIEIITSNQ